MQSVQAVAAVIAQSVECCNGDNTLVHGVQLVAYELCQELGLLCTLLI